MHHYFIYGDVLASQLEFPELRAAPPTLPRWRFYVDFSLQELPGGELLGEEHIYGDVSARLLKARTGGYWIHVPDTGLYHLSEDGSEIRWRPNPDPWWDFGRAHLMGRVLATALHLGGTLTLHGSAVVLGEGAVAFLAPKRYGKSTLALSLVERGARLLTDDALPVEVVEREVVARPGVHSLRLGPETRRRLGVGLEVPENREGKAVVTDLPVDRLATERTKLRAIYLLAPTDPSASTETVVRRDVGRVRAALALNGHGKIGEMLGAGEAPLLLERAGEVARRVPVRLLGLVHDFDRLGEGVERLMEWHGGPAVGAGREGHRGEEPAAGGAPEGTGSGARG